MVAIRKRIWPATLDRDEADEQLTMGPTLQGRGTPWCAAGSPEITEEAALAAWPTNAAETPRISGGGGRNPS
ncbi:hypothetical protein MRX96_006575 [Rhipicephalus microplus]